MSYVGEVKIVFYEDLRENTRKALREIVEFINKENVSVYVFFSFIRFVRKKKHILQSPLETTDLDTRLECLLRNSEGSFHRYTENLLTMGIWSDYSKNSFIVKHGISGGLLVLGLPFMTTTKD